MLSLRKEIESKKQSKILFLRIIKSNQIVLKIHWGNTGEKRGGDITNSGKIVNMQINVKMGKI